MAILQPMNALSSCTRKNLNFIAAFTEQSLKVLTKVTTRVDDKISYPSLIRNHVYLAYMHLIKVLA